jgi:ankyrin repeat protein
MEAVEARSPAVVRLLVRKGANVNSKDNDEWTALKQALLVGCLDIADLLKKAGATE